MIKKTYIILLLLSTAFFSSSGTHPIKLTSSIIKYSANNKAIKMDCKVFIDDFSPVISPTLEAKVIALKLGKEDISGIENYFIKYYKVYINGKKLGIQFTDYKVKDNVMTISFSLDYVAIKKGDKLKIENELLFDTFPDLQSNWVTIQIPPFLRNYNYESNFENYLYTHTF